MRRLTMMIYVSWFGWFGFNVFGGCLFVKIKRICDGALILVQRDGDVIVTSACHLLVDPKSRTLPRSTA